MPGQHAFLAPSDYEGWSRCPGKPALEEHEPDRSSPDADFGTECHTFTHAVLSGAQCIDTVPEDYRDLVRQCQEALYEQRDNYIRQGARVILLFEQKLDVGIITTEKNAHGRLDVLLIADFGEHAVLEVWDWKFGVGVKVSPEGNGQLSMYALAGLLKLSALHSFNEVQLVIFQPRVSDRPARWQTTPDELYVFGKAATEAGALALSLRDDMAALSHLIPGEKQCRWCRVKARCPALKAYVEAEVLEEIAGTKPALVEGRINSKRLKLTLKQGEYERFLGESRDKVELVMAWVNAIIAESDRMLAAGAEIPGWKRVAGRMGDRMWKDEETALLRVLQEKVPRNQVMTAPELLSPAQLEKVLKGKAYAAMWKALEAHIKQAPGKPTTVVESDPRPPWSEEAQAEDFEDVS